jgi:SAM-dependent methyltransferase
MIQPPDWADDEAFWEAMEPALCSESRLKHGDPDVAAICRGLGLTRPARVLDLACGPGAHALAFAARGHRVTGVDLMERYLNRARKASAGRGLEVEWLRADMRTFQRPGHFDLVCSLYNSLAYFDDTTNRQILQNVRASLRRGGRAFLDLLSRETVAVSWSDRHTAEFDDVSYAEDRSLTDGGSVLVSDWRVTCEGKQRRFRVVQHLYSEVELRRLLAEVGFSQVSAFGSLDCSSPFDHTAARFVAVGVR